MYSALVEKIVDNISEKDLILTGVAYEQGQGSKLTIYGMCRLDSLEQSLQALTVMREMWTPESTVLKPGVEITVRIRNLNAAIAPELLDYHPVLCVFNSERTHNEIEFMPQLS